MPPAREREVRVVLSHQLDHDRQLVGSHGARALPRPRAMLCRQGEDGLPLLTQMRSEGRGRLGDDRTGAGVHRRRSAPSTHWLSSCRFPGIVRRYRPATGSCWGCPAQQCSDSEPPLNACVAGSLQFETSSFSSRSMPDMSSSGGRMKVRVSMFRRSDRTSIPYSG